MFFIPVMMWVLLPQEAQQCFEGRDCILDFLSPPESLGQMTGCTHRNPVSFY